MKIFFGFLAGVIFVGTVASAARGDAWTALYCCGVAQLFVFLARKCE